MNGAPSPELSAILVTDSLETIRKTLAYFRAQEGSERLEIVIVAPRAAGVTADAPELEGFAQTRIVEVDDVSRPPLVRAEGVRAATAPLVLFAETHAYPRPGYVKALVRAHQAGPWAAVGPAMGNANPDSLLSWANLYLDYAPWVESKRRGVAEDVPGHNAVYKREALLAFGDDLPQQLRADHLMHGELRTRGHELYLEPDAKIDHTNVSHPWWTVVERFQSARNFAGLRARGWGWARRLAYVGGSPLIPVVRLTRVLRDVRRAGHTDLLPRLLPVLLYCLVISAAGEVLGYAFGTGRNPILYDIEVHRRRYTKASDQRFDADEQTWPG
jgi:hypothetical protein